MRRPEPPGEPLPRRLGDQIVAEDFLLLQRLMLKEAGIVLDAGKEYLVEARLSALALREGFATVRALLDAVQTEDERGPLHRRVVEALAITETSFFRDLWPFDAIRREILPDLIARHGAERTLNLWSAACSCGQEPYSLAMLVREDFPQLLNWNLRLQASDMSRAAITRATAGVYSQIEVNRGLPARLLVRYFEREGTEWHVREELRRMVQFREQNLIHPWPVLPSLHLILMRNVLLYFHPALRTRVLESAARALAPGGYLVLGGGETTLTVGDPFLPVAFGRTVIYRNGPAPGGLRGLAA